MKCIDCKHEWEATFDDEGNYKVENFRCPKCNSASLITYWVRAVI